MKYVSINKHIIARNARHNEARPPIRIARSRHDRNPVYCMGAEIIGPARLTYNPGAPLLKCGARLILECKDAIPINE